MWFIGHIVHGFQMFWNKHKSSSYAFEIYCACFKLSLVWTGFLGPACITGINTSYTYAGTSHIYSGGNNWKNAEKTLGVCLPYEVSKTVFARGNAWVKLWSMNNWSFTGITPVLLAWGVRQKYRLSCPKQCTQSICVREANCSTKLSNHLVECGLGRTIMLFKTGQDSPDASVSLIWARCSCVPNSIWN